MLVKELALFDCKTEYKLDVFEFGDGDFRIPGNEETLFFFRYDYKVEPISIFQFATRCIYKEYQIRLPYTGDDYTWEQKIQLYTQKEIAAAEFRGCFNMYLNELIIPPFPILADNDICNSYSLHEDWDYVVQVAQVGDTYLGFSWETTV